MELDALTLDESKRNDGIWYKYLDGEFLIAAAENDAWQVRHTILLEERRSLLRNEDETPNIAAYQALLIQCMAETILLGWRRLTDKGVELPYSVENAVRVLTVSVPLRSWVWERARQIEPYSILTDERGKKTSKPSSSGTTSTEKTSDGLPNSP